jgi:hypothetical protein
MKKATLKQTALVEKTSCFSLRDSGHQKMIAWIDRWWQEDRDQTEYYTPKIQPGTYMGSAFLGSMFDLPSGNLT